MSGKNIILEEMVAGAMRAAKHDERARVVRIIESMPQEMHGNWALISKHMLLGEILINDGQ